MVFFIGFDTIARDRFSYSNDVSWEVEARNANAAFKKLLKIYKVFVPADLKLLAWDSRR